VVTPRVTVVIATYNWATVLPYAIGSVLDQTFTDFELLVAGDHCTDESAAVVGEIAASDARVSWHDLERNTGHQSGPNNAAIARARGDVVAYLGHDDLWLPRHLELLVGTIDRGAPLAHATALLVRPDGSARQWPVRGWSWSPDEWLPPTSVVHTRALAETTGGWRHPAQTGSRDPETDLWARMASAARPPVWLPTLTSVKFPAALRRDVYRDRPCDEQAAWLARIRATEDPETALSESFPDRAPWPERAMAALRSTVALRTRLRRAGVFRGAPATETAEHRRVARRRFKGLP
jgi:glycosyltransferase involved in cell wall biosynthesis